MSKPLEIEGMKFGRLTAIRYSHTKNNLRYWECICECGATVYVAAKQLKRGGTKSCGCAKMEWIKKLKYKDGRCMDRLYGVWQTMLKRCYKENSNTYKYYGAKGIKVCEAWHEYSNFKEWAMANGYKPDAPKGECTIDRIDCMKDYEPENCRWVNMDVQRKNKRHGVNPYRDEKGRYSSKERAV